MSEGYEDRTQMTCELPPLVCVTATLTRLCASVQVAALPHVLQQVSALLDYSGRAYWSIPRACERRLGFLTLLNRLQAREPQDIDQHCKAHLFSSALVNVAQRAYKIGEDNEEDRVQHDLPLVQWLHAYLPTGNASRGMEEAARSGKLHVLQWLGTNHERITWSSRFMEVAAEEEHLKVLQWLARDGRVLGPDWGWLISLAASYGRLDVVAWIHDYVVEAVPSLSEGALEEKDAPPWDDIACSAAQNLQTSVVRDLHAHGYQVTLLSMHALLTDASTEKVQWLHDHSFPIYEGTTLDIPAASENLPMLQWLDDYGVVRCTIHAMNGACATGHLEVVKWLHVNRTEGCTAAAMNNAASRGHFEVVKWLHDHRTEGCTTNALNGAAGEDYLELVQWLHANREESCTTSAMDVAAENGHLEVVQWLHGHRSEGCTAQAMDAAAKNGHLHVVQWLHENRSEGCMTKAMVFAVYAGDLKLLRWLHEHRTEGCTTGVMNRAMMTGDFEIALFLHANRSEGCNEKISHSDWLLQHLEMLAWACEHYHDKLHIESMFRRVDMAHHPYLEPVLEELVLLPPRQH